MIRAAKKKKLNVSCSVAIHNLCFTDEALTDFDTNYKVKPPLRTQNDVDALIAGLKDGTIDMVTSDHNPLNPELKHVEFEHAHYGTIGLESAFGALSTQFSLKKTIQILTRGKSRFGVESTSIDVGNRADMTLFDPSGSLRFGEEHIRSKSKNSIFLNSTLKGQVFGIISNNKILLKS